jgi:hypothetical protein
VPRRYMIALPQRLSRRKGERIMPDAKSEAAGALDAHGRSIDDLHRKLAGLPGCDQDRLTSAVNKYKAAHQTFHDDALACVGF